MDRGETVLRPSKGILVSIIALVLLGLTRAGADDVSVAVQRADSCRLPERLRTTDPAGSARLLGLARSMERLADSATATLVESGWEFSAWGSFYSSAGEVAAYATSLNIGNAATLLEAARLQVRAAMEGEGWLDTARMAEAVRYLTCASERAAGSGDSALKTRADSLWQEVQTIRSQFRPRK